MLNPFDEVVDEEKTVTAQPYQVAAFSTQQRPHTLSAQDETFNSIPPDDILYTCSPLVQLKIHGICCPLFETEDYDARIGAQHLQDYPIVWYRKKLIKDVAKDVSGPVSNVSKEAGGLIDGIVNRFMGNRSVPMTHVGVPSLLSIVDTQEHGPVIEIRANEESSNCNHEEEWTKSMMINNTTIIIQHKEPEKPWWEDLAIKPSPPNVIIPLYLIDRIGCGYYSMLDPTAGGVKLYAAPQASSGLFGRSGSELLRFDTLGGGGNVLSDSFFPVTHEEPNKYSNKVIAQLKSLIVWNRRRVARDIKEGWVACAPKGNNLPGFVTVT